MTATKTVTKHAEKNFEGKWGRAIAAAGYTQIPDALILYQARLGLSPLEVCILLVLLKYAHPGKPTWVSKKLVANTLGIDTSTVRKRITALHKRGFVRREERKHAYGDSDTNRYHLEGLVERLEEYATELVEQRKQKKAAQDGKKPGLRQNARLRVLRGGSK